VDDEMYAAHCAQKAEAEAGAALAAPSSSSDNPSVDVGREQGWEEKKKETAPSDLMSSFTMVEAQTPSGATASASAFDVVDADGHSAVNGHAGGEADQSPSLESASPSRAAEQAEEKKEVKEAEDEKGEAEDKKEEVKDEEEVEHEKKEAVDEKEEEVKKEEVESEEEVEKEMDPQVDRTNAGVVPYVAAVKELGLELGLAVVDLYTATSEPAGDKTSAAQFVDGLHLSPEGNTTAFNQICSTIETSEHLAAFLPAQCAHDAPLWREFTSKFP
jgi:hypothetical protein